MSTHLVKTLDGNISLVSKRHGESSRNFIKRIAKYTNARDEGHGIEHSFCKIDMKMMEKRYGCQYTFDSHRSRSSEKNNNNRNKQTNRKKQQKGDQNTKGV